jgi:hypothetical protein
VPDDPWLDYERPTPPPAWYPPVRWLLLGVFLLACAGGGCGILRFIGLIVLHD